MENIIKRYRHRFQRLFILYIFVSVLFCVPTFLFLNTKVKGYMNAKTLSEVDAEIRTVKKDDFTQGEWKAILNKDNMLNRTFMIDQEDVLGPIQNKQFGSYYLVHLDDEFFVVVKSANGNPTQGKGRLTPIAKQLQATAFAYVSQEDYVVGKRNADTVISPYMMEIGYAGSVTTSQMYMILFIILVGFILLLYVGYRLFQASALRLSMKAYEDSNRRAREIMNYEVTHEKQVTDVIFGRFCLYLKRHKRSTVIMPLKYDQVVWYYEKKSRKQLLQIIVYDCNQQCYHIDGHGKRHEEIMRKIAERAPYAICGYDERKAKLVKHHFFVLLKQVSENRQTALIKKQCIDEEGIQAYE